jgi:hypothetical protein
MPETFVKNSCQGFVNLTHGSQLCPENILNLRSSRDKIPRLKGCGSELFECGLDIK